MGASSADDARFGYGDVKPLTDRLVAMLRKEMGDRLVGVALYGSVARGEARSDSDIDVLVVHGGSRSEAFAAVGAAERSLRHAPERAALRSRGVPTEFASAVFSEKHFADTPWLLLDISHHGIILFDREHAVHRKLTALRKRLEELGSRRVETPDGSWYWDLKPDLRPGEIVHL